VARASRRAASTVASTFRFQVQREINALPPIFNRAAATLLGAYKVHSSRKTSNGFCLKIRKLANHPERFASAAVNTIANPVAFGSN